MKSDFLHISQDTISKVAIHKKFTPECVVFLKAVLNHLLIGFLPSVKDLNNNSFFSCVNIKDSSKFKLPVSYAKDYPSYGGFNKFSSLMNIQFEYDIISGNWTSIDLTKATRNDQTDSKETITKIRSKGLYIRDLGYVTTTYLKGIQDSDAFFINRLPKMNFYLKNEEKLNKLDWGSLDKRLKRENKPYTEIEGYIGFKEQLKCRLIIQPVTEQEAGARIRKAKQGGNRTKGYGLSKEYKIKAHYNIFITNVANEVLSSAQVIETYQLRWQIELVFKSWKSNLNIHRTKTVKTPRMESQLIIKLIWLIINMRFYYIATRLIAKEYPDSGCSIIKFIKFIDKYTIDMIESMKKRNRLLSWFNQNVSPMLRDLRVEKRLKKPTHYELLHIIANC
mgnify:CR=1 FL=1